MAMAKRVDYQDPNGDLAEVHERRNAEIRAWAAARIAASDAHLTGDHVTTVDDWDVLEADTGEYNPPGGEWQLTDEESQPVDNSVDEPETSESEPETQPEQEEEQEEPAPAKKTAAKKSAAAKSKAEPKDASD